MKRFIIVDGTGLVYRGFYAIPPFLRSPEGVQTNAVFGFTNIILSLLEGQKPDYLAVAFDKKGPTFRHKEFAAYKATRIKAPQELYDQIPLSKKVLEAFGIPLFEVDGFEADDIIATITHDLSKSPSVECIVATGDFDLFQLVNSTTAILYPTKGFKGAEILRAADIKERYGVLPQQIPDYKGLAGDSSDNIPGVRGIGDKRAIALLEKYGTLEKIYEHLNEITRTVGEKLAAGREDAFKCRQLTRLREDVTLTFRIEECHVKDFSASRVRKLFSEFGFKSLIKRLDELYKEQAPQQALL